MNETNGYSLLPVRHITVTADQAGQRIDNFLAVHLKGVPRSHLYRLLRRGEVRVNKGRVGPEYRIGAGDVVRLPPLRQSEPTAPIRPSKNVLELIQERILFEDEGLLVLNKPHGLAVHGGSGLHFGAIEALRALRPEAPCLELVHRLDRDTSGLLMVAKRRSVLRHLHALLREGRLDKRYLTLVAGTWPSSTRTIDAPLLTNHLQSGERVVRVDATGKPSATRFTVLAAYSNPLSATLLEARPMTGRTHQIRVHARFAGHPVGGDEKYGDDEFDRAARTLGLNRLFLHAYRLTIETDGQKLSLEAPLDEALQRVLSRLDTTPTSHNLSHKKG